MSWMSRTYQTVEQGIIILALVSLIEKNLSHLACSSQVKNQTNYLRVKSDGEYHEEEEDRP